ncbi:hypothetical protein ACLB1N_16825 [Escherichia coli]
MVGGTVTAIWTAKDAYDNPVTSHLHAGSAVISSRSIRFYGIWLDE